MPFDVVLIAVTNWQHFWNNYDYCERIEFACL